MSDTSTVVNTSTTTSTKVKPPGMFDVVFYNDNKTYHQFVVLILMQLYGKDYDSAMEITDMIHEKGKKAVATYTYEVAAAKRDETVTTARMNGYPLRVELEPNSGDVQ
jgi:ATP-dependent Clp protease adaptor protein ClpS